MTEWKILRFDELSSTNDYAKELVLDGVQTKNTVIYAEAQTSGRGQGENKWFSSKGKGVYFSLIMKPEVDISKLIEMPIVVGKILSDFLLLRFKGISLQIKPPNDILSNGKKIAGILVESILIGSETKSIIIGIGLNDSHEKGDFPEDIRKKSISLKQLIGNGISNKIVFIKDFLLFFDKRFGEYLDDLQKL